MTIEDRRNWMWSEALQMLARADRLHREVFNPPGAAGSAAGWEPPVDVLETEDARTDKRDGEADDRRNAEPAQLRRPAFGVRLVMLRDVCAEPARKP